MLGHRLADIAVPETPWEVLLRGLVSRALIGGGAGDAPAARAALGGDGGRGAADGRAGAGL